jgi:hypothetical protein
VSEDSETTKPKPKAKTAWHWFFYQLLEERKPAEWLMEVEVSLWKQPPRLDVVLLRRQPMQSTTVPTDSLHRLWEQLSSAHVAILEYKSPSEKSATSVSQLFTYGYGYLRDNQEQLAWEPSKLALVWVLSSLTKTLREELKRHQMPWQELAPGFLEVQGRGIGCYFVLLDTISEEESDALLGTFGSLDIRDKQAKLWWNQHLGDPMATPEELEQYDELEQKYLESLPPARRLRGLKPEDLVRNLKPEDLLRNLKPAERVQGLAPEERLQGIAPEEMWKVMPMEIVRGLNSEAIANLPEEIQAVIRERLQTSSTET